MALITVQGASAGATVNVTVDGAATGNLGSLLQQFSTSLTSGIAAGTIDGEDLSTGKTSFGSNTSGYGVITAGGSYSVSGNVGAIVFGGPAAAGVVPSSHVIINASGVTSSFVSVEGGTTGGVQFQAGSGAGAFVAATGDNAYTGDQLSGAGNWTVTTGDGDDTIVAGTGQNTINAGTGDNLIEISNGTNYVKSYGNDTIFGGDCSFGQHVTLYGGSSFVTLGEQSYVNDVAGNDQITVGGSSTVIGGDSDSISLNGGVSSVIGGTSDTISASGDAVVSSSDNATVSVDGSLTFIGGTGNSTITAAQSTIFGAGGLNAVIAGSGDTLFVAGSGSETLNGASSGSPLHAFGNNAGTTGSQVFIGGTAADTLVAGVGDATMTGGSGAANVFALRDGIAGANYTITDFSSAAGNFVALLGYSQSDLTNALSTQTTTDGNTTVKLADNSTITFDNVSSLNSSDFHLW